MPITDALNSRLKDKSLLRAAVLYRRALARDGGERHDVRGHQSVERRTARGAAQLRRGGSAARDRGGGSGAARWARKTGKERAAVLRRLYDLMIANADDLAAIMTAEQGKPLAEAQAARSLYGASYVEWFGEEAKRVYGDIIPGHQEDKRIIVHQAAGRRRGDDHAVELPQLDAGAQDGAGAGRRLRAGEQAGGGDAALGASRWRCWPSGPGCRRASSTCCRRPHAPATRQGVLLATRRCGRSASPARPRSGAS